jgi:hypothetical protein
VVPCPPLPPFSLFLLPGVIHNTNSLQLLPSSGICYEALAGKAEELVSCKDSCSYCFHAQCFHRYCSTHLSLNAHSTSPVCMSLSPPPIGSSLSFFVLGPIVTLQRTCTLNLIFPSPPP